jgi:hypothetical protein
VGQIITAGYFATEDWENGPKWDEQVKMYTTSAISPPFLIHSLHRAKHLSRGAKVVLVSSELAQSLFDTRKREGETTLITPLNPP